jgi:hypothetical protein
VRRWLLVCLALGLVLGAAAAWLRYGSTSGSHEPMDEDSRRELRQVIREEPEP